MSKHYWYFIRTFSACKAWKFFYPKCLELDYEDFALENIIFYMGIGKKELYIGLRIYYNIVQWQLDFYEVDINSFATRRGNKESVMEVEDELEFENL